jgi:hypothetical protein
MHVIGHKMTSANANESKLPEKFGVSVWQNALKNIKTTAFGRIFIFDPVSGDVQPTQHRPDPETAESYVYVELGRRMKFTFRFVECDARCDGASAPGWFGCLCVVFCLV